MRAVFTLAWKDIRNLLSSPMFFVISGLCTLVWSYSYMRKLLEFAEASRQFAQPGMDTGMNMQQSVFLPLISQINLLYIFMVPALTMRLLAEEKRQRTYDLLLTSPVSATQIAIGKFLGGLGAVSALTAISFLYPLFTRLAGDFPLGPLLSAYAGVILVSATYVAVGLFASSLTESVVLSVILALIFNILLWFIAQGAGENSLLSQVMEYMSIGQHFMDYIMGAVRLNSTVFFLSLIGLFVFLTQRVVESSRWR